MKYYDTRIKNRMTAFYKPSNFRLFLIIHFENVSGRFEINKQWNKPFFIILRPFLCFIKF